MNVGRHMWILMTVPWIFWWRCFLWVRRNGYFFGWYRITYLGILQRQLWLYSVEHLLRLSALWWELTHEYIDYGICCYYFWFMGFSQLNLNQERLIVCATTLNLTICYMKGSLRPSFGKVRRFQFRLEGSVWEKISNQYAKMYLCWILTDK